jgi:hypothetical protein
VGGEVQPVPDRLLDLGRALALDVAWDVQEALPAALAHRDAAHAVADERRKVRMREAVAEEQLGIEAVGVAALAGHKRHDHVCVALLRADEGGGVGLAAIELGQHLVGRVPAPGAVALHLPPAP